jgi:hypothetical protein
MILMMKLSRLALAVLLIPTFAAGIPTTKSLAYPLLDRIATTTTSQSSTSVTIESKTVRWHSGKKSEGFPTYRETIVRYPIVISLQDPTVLKKVETALSLKSILGQSLAELRQDKSPWLTDLAYTINYNQNSILDVTYTISGMGAYPSTSEKRVSIDLITGNVLQAKNLFKTDGNVALAQSIDKMMQQKIQAKIVEVRKDIPDLEVAMFSKHHFKPKDLNDFTIGKKGVTFHYNFDFIHAIKAAEPSGAYFISYEKLSRYIRPDGAIGFALGRSRK